MFFVKVKDVDRLVNIDELTLVKENDAYSLVGYHNGNKVNLGSYSEKTARSLFKDMFFAIRHGRTYYEMPDKE